ncbi:hypothetical protein DMP17_13385 [Pseudonocardia sp. TMWB2A]
MVVIKSGITLIKRRAMRDPHQPDAPARSHQLQPRHQGIGCRIIFKLDPYQIEPADPVENRSGFIGINNVE